MDYSLLQVIKKERENFKEDFEDTVEEDPPPFYIEVDMQRDQCYDQCEWSYYALKTSFEEICTICGKVYKNRYLLLQHNITHLNVTLEPIKIIKRENHKKISKHIKVTDFMHQCDICNKIFSYKTWNAHIKEVHINGCYTCEECGHTFKCKRYLKRHIRNVHNLEIKKVANCHPPIKCEICFKMIKNKASLYCHMRNMHNTKPHKCEICGSELKCYAYYLVHQRRVHYNDGVEHRCDLCGKIFKSSRYVSIHKKNSHRPRIVKKLRADRRMRMKSEKVKEEIEDITIEEVVVS